MALPANVQRAIDRLVTVHGYSPVAAAGLVGQFMGESGRGLDVTAYNPNDPGGSKGIGQWNRDRRAAMQAYQSPHGASDELERQIDFAAHELNTTEKRAGRALRAATTVDEAAQAGIGYERPAGYTRDNPTAGHNYAGRLGHTKDILAGRGILAAGASPTSGFEPVTQDGRTMTIPGQGVLASAGTAASPAYDLSGHLVAGKDKSILQGVGSNLSTRFGTMIQAAPPEIQKQLQILSAYRSPEHQERLWQDALKKYGSPEIARKWVAPPGKSQHGHGNAFDLRYASPAAREWAHKNAAQYGLAFPLGNEPWHIETAEARGGPTPPGFAAPPTDHDHTASPDAATGSPPGVIAAAGEAPASPASGADAFATAFESVQAAPQQQAQAERAQAVAQSQVPAPPPISQPGAAPGQPGQPDQVAAADLMTSLLERKRAARVPPATMPRGMLSGWA